MTWVTATTYLGTHGSIVVFEGCDQDTGERVTIAADARASWAALEMVLLGESVTIEVEPWQVLERHPAAHTDEWERDLIRRRQLAACGLASEWAPEHSR